MISCSVYYCDYMLLFEALLFFLFLLTCIVGLCMCGV